MGRADDMKYGCVRFDNTREHRRGWAAIAGEKAYRIASTKDLRSDIIWLHNLGYEMTFEAGMERHAGLRRNDYLSERFIGEENKNGYDIAGLLNSHDGAQQVERVAKLFDRVMMITDHFGVRGAPTPALHQGLHDLLLPSDQAFSKNIVEALDGATIEYVSAEQEIRYGDTYKKMTLTLPRVEHGIRCASVSLPEGDWSEIGIPNGRGQDAIDEWISNQVGVYTLVQCVLENTEEGWHRLINFGSGRTTRKWVTGIELMLLNRVSNITIKKAYAPASLSEIVQLEPIKEAHDPFHDLSVSIGIVWQNIWLGLAGKKDMLPHLRKNRSTINPLKPFVRSIDINQCLLAANNLQNMGVIVHSYGKGKIHIWHDGDDESLINACRVCNVIPPFLGASPQNNIESFTPVSMMQEIYIQGSYEELDKADKQIVALICK